MHSTVRKNVMVVGMPRSGTSMTAYLFARQGYFAAEAPEEELRPGDVHNPTGYWESQPLIQANTELFRRVGYGPDNTWLHEPMPPAAAESITALPPDAAHRALVARYEAHAPWLWKDPRLCFTLGYWWPLMNPATTAVLLVRRDPEQIFQSFRRLGWARGQAERAQVVSRVHAHITAAQQAIAAYRIPHLVVDYGDFASRPVETAARISGYFGVAVEVCDLGYRPLLNHSRGLGKVSTRALALSGSLPSGLRRALRRCTPGLLLDWLFPGLRQ